MTGPVEWPHPVPEQRIAPVPPDQRSEATAEVLAGLQVGGDDGEVANIFTTLAHHPRLLKRWTAFGGVLLFRGELSGRDRELLILRTAWNCRAHYEWDHHVTIGRGAGLSDDEIARVTEGPAAAGWTATEAALLRAADELHDHDRIDEGTWSELAESYSPAQLVEVCMIVGQYHLVAFTLNSLGVQLED
ncbi:MAG TPA: carboxymuconolactone decarboxylase family protein [Acidimicrobiales bacterium]|nr:carboxymuconolactone decarboxylase family protein [Acidimicrobiales bacterium]